MKDLIEPSDVAMSNAEECVRDYVEGMHEHIENARGELTLALALWAQNVSPERVANARQRVSQALVELGGPWPEPKSYTGTVRKP